MSRPAIRRLSRRTVRVALLLALLTALALPAAAAPAPDSLAGLWTGTTEDTAPDGSTMRYRVELRFSPPDGTGGRRAELVARTTMQGEGGGAAAVTVRGTFSSTDPEGRKFHSPDVTVQVETGGAAQSVGPLWLLLDPAEGNRLTGRLGTQEAGWNALTLTRREAPDPAPDPAPALGEHPPVYSLISTLPGVGELRAPEWAKPGVRVSFWMGSAIINHDAFRSTLTPDPNGSLIDPDTGQRYGESTLPGGTGAVGFTQIDVVAVAPDAVVMQVSNFLHDGSLARPALTDIAQVICHPSGCEYWIHPRALEQLAAMGGFVFSGQRVMNGESREVVVVKNGNGHNVYDAATGILVSMSMRSSSSKPTIYFDPSSKTGTTGGAKGTTLIVTQLRGVRETWRGRLAGLHLAASVDGLQGIEARSVRTFQMDAGGGVQRTPGKLTIEPVRRAGNRLVVRVTVTGPGLPPRSQLRVSCPVEEGSTFLPPAFLQVLEEGRVLDEDPVTGYSTRVTFVGEAPDGRPIAILTRAGATESTRFVYDTKAGLLISLDQVERAAGTTTRLQVEVVRTW